MKKILIILSLLITGFTSYSQGQLQPLKYYKVVFHIVRTSAGTTNITGLELDIQKAIKYMNDKFIGANIQFYTCGIDYIDDDLYYNYNQDYNRDKILVANYNDNTAVNAYLFNSITDLWGYTYLPKRWELDKLNIIGLRNEIIHGQLVTVTHEFGLFFGIPHTHEYGGELVNRENCTTHGDLFCDTPADPELHFSDDVDENCDYIGGAVDANGQEYDPDESLIMSHSRHECRTRFSQEQLAEANFFANHAIRIGFSHMQYFENTTITTDYDIEEDVILIKDTKIENNAEVKLKSCAFVEISGDSEVKLGSTLDIRIE